MDDIDTPTLLILAVVIVLVLKPDLLSSLFGGKSSSSTPQAYAPGGYTLLQPPPAASGGVGDPASVRAWQAAGLGDGSGRDEKNRAMPVGWTPGQPIWNDLNKAMGDAAVEAYKRAHPCPDHDQVWNSILGKCVTPYVSDGTGGGGTWEALPAPCGYVTNKDGIALPAPCPPRSEGVPDSVAQVKAAQKRAALFTPWSNA
jgi:hypothetical protein